MLFERLQKESLEARKARDTVRAGVLTTAISQVKALAIDDGHRAPNDADVLKVVRQFLKSCEENLALAAQGKMDASRAEQFKVEKDVLLSFLPQQMSAEDLKAAITKSGATNIGEVMKYLKANHDGQYDGKLASQVAKEVIG
ncbi:MAG TPA: GatB/YqeY domain-containing protein [Turneriella sp.]|nr:GatB/YqeY domain-containing protein [Turneriella sp.]HMY11818.1 GatB/YqeY domain-containing protein [Turneriella sp.]HNA80313.1 GatB/YqeY domain-containing protein [Turneriella sp.]HNE21021.1 GatB/YqeY domain-containing protein [Turneriella sp.]HNJ64545.1 GatB/YqeY domain-containing protein [Turneriella sp.]